MINDKQDDIARSFSGAKTRRLHAEEKSFVSPDSVADFPLVIEPVSESEKSELGSFLRENSDAIQAAVRENGAVLFRGWQLANEIELERAVLEIEGLKPVKEQFMREQGRVIVPGTKVVYYTNTNRKTGGTFQPPGFFFHAENYYQLDVPTFMFFWSQQASLLGGETGLVHMGRAYPLLAAELRAKIESEPVFVDSWPLSRISQIYKLDEDLLERTLTEHGFEIRQSNGKKHVLLFKPPVVHSTLSQSRSLQVNFKELMPISRRVRDLMFANYKHPKWTVHRLAWAHPKVARFLNRVDEFLFKKPGELDTDVQGYIPGPNEFNRFRLAAKITAEDAESIATTMADHLQVFSWQSGDLLFFDNLQVLHSGLPGFGSRELRVIMANPVQFERPLKNGVGVVSAANEKFANLQEILLRMRP